MTSSKMSSDSSTECSEVVLGSEVNLATFAGGKRVGSLSEVDDLPFDPYGNQHNNKTVMKRSQATTKSLLIITYEQTYHQQLLSSNY